MSIKVFSLVFIFSVILYPNKDSLLSNTSLKIQINILSLKCKYSFILSSCMTSQLAASSFMPCLSFCPTL